MDQETRKMASVVEVALKCCIRGTCSKCPYEKFFDDCGDRLNADALTLIRAAYKTKEDQDGRETEF